MTATATHTQPPPEVAPGPAQHRRRLRPYALGELLIVFVLVWVYDMIKALAATKLDVGLDDASGVRSLERTLHVDIELSVNRWTNHHHLLSLVCAYCYQYLHEGLTLAVLVALWWLAPRTYRPARNALVGINVAGLLVFALYPVAPPRLLPHAGFVDTVANAGFGANHSGPIVADQFAAMPSLHLAWATWVAIVLFRWWRRPVLRALAVAYPVWMAYVVIGTANHYVLDVAAGVVVAVGCFALALWLDHSGRTDRAAAVVFRHWRPVRDRLPSLRRRSG